MQIENGQQQRNTISASMTFAGCKVTSFLVDLTYSPSNDKKTHVRVTLSPFDLSTLRPDKITVTSSTSIRTLLQGQFGYDVLISSIAPITASSLDDDGPHYESQGMGLSLSFPTKEIADRQAKAWHDAIIGCGGKAVPDNLY
jgi:hypothetical protein